MKKFNFTILLLAVSALSIPVMAEEPSAAQAQQAPQSQNPLRFPNVQQGPEVKEPTPPGIDQPQREGEGSVTIEDSEQGGSNPSGQTPTPAPAGQ